jgi:hypothetical protein
MAELALENEGKPMEMELIKAMGTMSFMGKTCRTISFDMYQTNLLMFSCIGYGTKPLSQLNLLNLRVCRVLKDYVFHKLFSPYDDPTS